MNHMGEFRGWIHMTLKNECFNSLIFLWDHVVVVPWIVVEQLQQHFVFWCQTFPSLTSFRNSFVWRVPVTDDRRKGLWQLQPHCQYGSNQWDQSQAVVNRQQRYQHRMIGDDWMHLHHLIQWSKELLKKVSCWVCLETWLRISIRSKFIWWFFNDFLSIYMCKLTI